MKSKNMTNFLSEHRIEIHFSSSSNHNANADIERLHNTINEHLRILKHTKRHIPIEEQMILINGYYNKTIHSTTGLKPLDFIQGKVPEEDYGKIYQKILQKKTKVIERLNSQRLGGNEKLENGINYIKETRGGKNHSKFRKIKANIIDPDHIQDVKSGQKYYRSHIKKRKKYQSNDKTELAVGLTSRRGNVQTNDTDFENDNQ